ncbi:MAG: hypothetical protein Q4A39_05185 [Eubacteriales bacterium]|nr:hypothetical protein [Eubacteriales bacterium]
MENLWRAWISGLSGAAVLGAVCVLLTSTGPVRSVTKMMSGTVLALAFLSPLVKLDMETFSLSTAQYREEAAVLTEEARELQERLSRIIIQEEYAAYIWDKAQSLGLTSGQAEVMVRWGGDCWVPDEVMLTFSGSEDKRNALANLVEAELGIPKERQYWNESH